MNLSTLHTGTHSFDPSVLPQPLTSAEVDQVAGGVVPIIIAGAVSLLITGVINEVCSDDSDSDDSSGDEQGN